MTRRPIPALLASAGVLSFLIVVDLASTLSLLLPVGFGNPLDAFGLQLLGQVGQDVLIGLGVFLVLWLLVPITASSTIGRAVAAGALAALGGAAVAAIITIVGALAFAREASGSLYDLIPLGIDPLRLVTNTIQTALHFLPLTVLAAVLVREWLRSHAATSPAEEPVSAV